MPKKMYAKKRGMARGGIQGAGVGSTVGQWVEDWLVGWLGLADGGEVLTFPPHRLLKYCEALG